MKSLDLRRRFADLGLARKLGAISLGGQLVASVLVCTLLAAAAWMTLRADLMRNSQTVASVLSHNIAPALQFEDPIGATEILSALAGYPEVTEAEVRHHDGELFALYRRPQAASARDRLVNGTLPDAMTWTAVSVPVELKDGRSGTLTLSIDMAHTYQRVTTAVIIILSTVALVFCVALALQLRWLKRMLLPVQSLLASMQRAGENADYSLRAPVQGRDEIGQLGTSFNTMMELIEERDRAMEHLAMHDSLTGLVNRHYLHMRAQLPALQPGQCSVLLYIDLDHFKHVNDTLGHSFGDRVLAALSNRLISMTTADDLLARFGGDEFVLCKTLNLATDDPLELAERVRRAIAAPLQLQGRSLTMHASVGIAIAPEHGKSVSELLQKADAAMHAAKDSGRDSVQRWHADITQRTNERFVLENDLRHAIADGQLSVAYQPIVEIASGKVVGMEALVRWRHPERGPVSPVEFIPVAEDSGLIIEIGAWVLEQACMQVRQWHARFGPLQLAVNVSGRQFRDPQLVQVVRSVCERTGYPTQLLHLEVTESTLMLDTESAARVMRQLVQLGLKLSLDDFGTGYSSLAYLKRFPLYKLKIDRSFVKDLPHNSDDGAIVKAIVNLARALDMRVLAEGIESEKQQLVLGAIGCDYGQGYHYSEPLAPADFERWLALQQANGSGIAGNAGRLSRDDPAASY